MFGSIGGPELLVIFFVALLIFGPRKLPELGRTIGKGIAQFRKASADLRDTLDSEVVREKTATRHNAAPTGPDDAAGPDPADAADAGKSNSTD